MKTRILTFLIGFIAISLGVNAQEYDRVIKLYKDGEVIFEYNVNELDSVKFEKEYKVGAVDLGLSVKWATCNVGATKPEGYGNYYAWGETETKGLFSSSNSTTYGKSISALKSAGIIDSNNNLTPAYDAATVNMGGSWRMPTKAEQDELRNNCTWEWTTLNNVNGYKVTGTNGNSIFLPAAGYRSDSSLYGVGSDGDYWSATAFSDSDGAYYLGFDSGYVYWVSGSYRFNGPSVRAVCE